jgi:hypothetical protein
MRMTRSTACAEYYNPITERPALDWPGGTRVAAYIGLNIEHFLIDRPSTSIWPGTADLVPDALNYGWRDYGPRVGIWRMIESRGHGHDHRGHRAAAEGLDGAWPDRDVLHSGTAQRPHAVRQGRYRA